jgi:hypothetical protein
MGRLRARSKLEGGIPLLHDEVLDLDIAFAFFLTSRLVVGHAQRGDAHAARALAVLQSGKLDPAALVEEAFVGHRDHLRQLTVELGPARDLLMGALLSAVTPLLQLAAQEVRSLLPLATWGLPYCPVCGSCGGIADSPGGYECPRCATAWDGFPQPERRGFRLELALTSGGDEDWKDD